MDRGSTYMTYRMRLVSFVLVLLFFAVGATAGTIEICGTKGTIEYGVVNDMLVFGEIIVGDQKDLARGCVELRMPLSLAKLNFGDGQLTHADLFFDPANWIWPGKTV